jgi:hypothetical protein
MITHDKMSEFYSAQITNHALISSEYVKFLASNSSVGEVVGVARYLSLKDTVMELLLSRVNCQIERKVWLP